MVFQKTLAAYTKKDFFQKDLSILKFPSDIKNILVIGGAGTIGSSYIKQILRFQPKKIVIVDINENALTELTRDLRSSRLLDYRPVYITYPINLLSETFDKIFWSLKFDLVANFSAHKHVRSEKDKISIEGLIKNNVYGAIKLLNLCSERPPKYFLVSRLTRRLIR
jgi:FlaA1/EpsC-like NDP-sugar epimerase